jgi:hypothetical protein
MLTRQFQNVRLPLSGAEGEDRCTLHFERSNFHKCVNVVRKPTQFGTVSQFGAVATAERLPAGPDRNDTLQTIGRFAAEITRRLDRCRPAPVGLKMK